MAIRKRQWTNKSGTHTTWVCEYRDRDGKWRLKTFPREKDAKAWEATTLVGVKAGTHTPDSMSITVREAVQAWIDNARTNNRERSTIQQYELHRDGYLCPATGGFMVDGRPLADLKLSRLTTPIVDEFRKHLLTHHSRAMARKVLKSLRDVLARAQIAGKIAVNVALAVKIEAETRDSLRVDEGKDYPTHGEVRAILAAATDPWSILLTTDAQTGLRASELRGLAWDHINFDKMVIEVRERADAWNQMGDVKRSSSNRDVPMTPELAAMLREWKVRCPRYRDPETGESRLWLVFPNGVGNHESHANITNRGLYAAQLKAEPPVVIKRKNRRTGKVELRPKYGIHALRHYFASCIIAAGFTPKRCQALLGHASITMTFDVYGHLFPNDADDATKMAKASGFVNG
jgi:integrase